MRIQPTSSAEVSERAGKKTVSGVIKSFNTWRFKREQPSDTILLEDFVAGAVSAGTKIPFVLYWGKGLRSCAGMNERACIDFLSEMGERIQKVYSPGAHFDILFTDTHAKLNGHNPFDIDCYLESLRAEAGSDFLVWRLSDVVARSRVGDDVMRGQTGGDPQEMISRLVGCAEKWYRGGGRASDGAAQYYWMNMRERIAVQSEFPRSIFVTFNGSELRDLFPPRLPVFYMYSIKKGTSVKPWFMDEPGALPPMAAATNNTDSWI